MQCPKAALFDLDDTLAESFKAPHPDMIERLDKVLRLMPVAILSAADLERIKRHVLDALPALPSTARLFVFADSASVGYAFENGSWQTVYTQEFSPEELEKIRHTLEEGVVESGIAENGSKYEPQILIAGTQVRYAALGLGATEADKSAWDPDKSKRAKLKKILDSTLPDCEVLMGGKTTIDITRKGIDKAYGVRWLSKHLNIPASDMLYVGDALYEGGNDFVVIETGIQTRSTSGPEETLAIIDELLTSCAT